jgi:hypothetical protein
MPNKPKRNDPLRDKARGKYSEAKPVTPGSAEGDVSTIEADLEQKDERVSER